LVLSAIIDVSNEGSISNMLQAAEIILAILGLCGAVSMQGVCWTVLGCEVARIICDIISKYLED
jgi:riboflavin synthase alpha subunit